jgi:diguanylate cyclase (GGDEF)-like protein
MRALVLLLAFSIGAIVFHRYDGLQINLPLLSQNENLGFGKISNENVTSNLVLQDDMPTVSCQLLDTTGYNYCGISIVLGDQPQSGRDLSLYNRIDLDISIQAPNEGTRVRLSLRNFNDAYSDPKDYVSLKFNSIKYDPNTHNGLIKVPLKAFQVESWWLEQYAIGFDNAQLDFSNIPYVEVVTDDMRAVGTYKIIIRKASLSGELISEQGLLKIILVVWLIVIMLIIMLQRNKLKTVSTTDSLTGLMNRRGLEEWVSKNLPTFAIGEPLTMFYFDLDDFKKINDSFGHLVGDELLCKFSDKISLILNSIQIPPTKYVFSRLSGDEFSLVFKGYNDKQTATLTKEIFRTFKQRIILSSSEVKVSISLGIASSDHHGNSFGSLMSRADSAMYYAKKRGKNQFKVFDDSVSKDILFRKQVAEKVRTALNLDEFSLKFMPIYHASDLALYGVEVLLRSDAPSLQNIGPDVFIPIAEEFDIIKDIDLWVIEATFKLIVANRDFIEKNPLMFGINISSVELHNSHFPKDIYKLLQKYEIAPEWLEMEITETSLIEADELSITVLNDIRDLGIKLSLDDFGTGYTAFNQLMRYPVDCLKIDKSFVDDLASKAESRKTMIKAILSIAKAYRLSTIAEGIETFSQYQFVTERGCDMVQGYLFSKPLDWEEVSLLVSESKENRMTLIKTE